MAKAQLDTAIVELLGLDPEQSTLSSHGGSSFTSTGKIEAVLTDGSKREYFIKTGGGNQAETMFIGEHESLNALHAVSSVLCPKSLGYGRYHSSPDTFFLVTEFMHTIPRHRGSSSGPSLAYKLARLHLTPAPIPPGHDRPQYGFPVTTCCGSTPQHNELTPSWADFYAARLRAILAASERSNNVPASLRSMVERTVTSVIPRLLGALDIQPVLVHGDLWSGNHAVAHLPSMPAGMYQDVVFDPSCSWAHSEFELGIMNMFGGFGAGFMSEYHRLCPKTEPKDEYDDRVSLYELYHHLNHYAMFGGSYRDGAARIMRDLLRKYGDD